MKGVWWLTVVFVCSSCVYLYGCSSSKGPEESGTSEADRHGDRGQVTTPVDPDFVQKQLTSDQLAVGDVWTISIGMVFVPIPPGEFMLGWTIEGQPKVKLTRPFFVSATEVTQSQWKSVMGTSPWRRKSLVDSGDHFPVIDVTWDQARDFCRKLSAKENTEYRLPTEAEWEFACRAGTKTAFSFGDDPALLGEHAWFRGNARSELANAIWTRRVARKKPNNWGLYDMHGNVEEMCLNY